MMCVEIKKKKCVSVSDKFFVFKDLKLVFKDGIFPTGNRIKDVHQAYSCYSYLRVLSLYTYYIHVHVYELEIFELIKINTLEIKLKNYDQFFICYVLFNYDEKKNKKQILRGQIYLNNSSSIFLFKIISYKTQISVLIG